MNKLKQWVMVLSLFWLPSGFAVTLNPKGVGEVLIFPYYTVNNDFNSYYSIVNSGPEPKALKIRFLEGKNSIEVLGFNLYLDAYDVWTGALVPTTSTISQHVGESSVLHIYNDNSCVLYLPSFQEFLPYYLDYQDSENNNLQRATEGHIEVIEMGTVTGSTAASLSHDALGMPQDCSIIESNWGPEGIWNIDFEGDPTTDMNASTGGISGSLTLINPTSGYAVGYDATALESFFNGNIFHTIAQLPWEEPDPLLAHAFPESSFIYENQMMNFVWANGAEALTSVFQQDMLINQFNLDASFGGSTEWVITHPTKYLHVNGTTPVPPFTNLWDSTSACEPFNLSYWDNEGYRVNDESFSSCFSVNVLEILDDDQTSTGTSGILGSGSLISLTTTNHINFTDQGWAEIDFDESMHYLKNNEQLLTGLPTLGFAIEKFNNASAAPGILAQYADLYPHKVQKKIIDDLIFIDHFEIFEPAINLFTINGQTKNIVVNTGEEVLIEWLATNVNSCAASTLPIINDWNGPIGISGNVTVPVNESTVFTLSCDDINASIEITTSSQPVINYFRINGQTDEVTTFPGESIVIEWSASNVDSCTALSSPSSSGWNNSVATQGSITRNIFQPTVFSLDCGTSFASINVDFESNKSCSNSVWPEGLTKVEKAYLTANQGQGFGETTNSDILESFYIQQFLTLSHLRTANENFRRGLQFYNNPSFLNPNWFVTLSISECPGDFTNSAVCQKTIFPAQQDNILISTNPADDSNTYCLIEANKSYYLNFVHDEDPSDTTPGRCQLANDQECGIFFREFIVN